MLVIISPTKQMKPYEGRTPYHCPKLIEDSKRIWNELKKLSIEDIKKLMKVNDKIAQENMQRYQDMKFDQNGSCALFTYQGLQFQYMRIETEEEIAYLEKHLRILSGFYGMVRPLDSIYPYRLEMQAKLCVGGEKDIYAFWNHKLADMLMEEVKTHTLPKIIDMASKEYEKAVLPYLPQDVCLTLTFKIRKGEKLKVESTQAKMARGRMIHYLAVNKIETLDGIKEFCEDGYRYEAELSSEKEFVFVKDGIV